MSKPLWTTWLSFVGSWLRYRVLYQRWRARGSNFLSSSFDAIKMYFKPQNFRRLTTTNYNTKLNTTHIPFSSPVPIFFVFSRTNRKDGKFSSWWRAQVGFRASTAACRPILTNYPEISLPGMRLDMLSSRQKLRSYLPLYLMSASFAILNWFSVVVSLLSRVRILLSRRGWSAPPYQSIQEQLTDQPA